MCWLLMTTYLFNGLKRIRWVLYISTQSLRFYHPISRIRIEYGDLHSKSLYLVHVQEEMDQKNSKYAHF